MMFITTISRALNLIIFFNERRPTRTVWCQDQSLDDRDCTSWHLVMAL